MLFKPKVEVYREVEVAFTSVVLPVTESDALLVAPEVRVPKFALVE